MNSIDKDLKLYWDLYEDMQKQLDKMQLQMKVKTNALKHIKQEIRKRNKLKAREIKPEDNWRCRYPDDGDLSGIYVKYKLPYHMTEEEKKSFIEDEWCHWYNPYGDGRDCTGVWFTSYINCIDCGNNETIVIHVKHCDC